MSGHRPAEPVALERHGAVAHVVIDWPPVNALSAPVRAGLQSRIGEAVADASVRAVVLRCRGRTFVAGGDIAEFAAPLQPPDVNEVNALIEDAPKPVVAALHGTVLGGGLELALACHGRVAAPGTRFGLPEVTLGLVPGAGGTQRLPRVVGLAAALEMVATGQPLEAERALGLGLVDAVAADPAAAAEAFALGLAEAAPRRTRDRPVVPEAKPERDAAIEGARQRASREAPWSRARQRAIEAVSGGLDRPFGEALLRERALFDACLGDAESRALIHLFFAERQLSRVPGLSRQTPVRNVASAAVVGAGTMGRGIAIVLADAGLPVVLVDADPAARERAASAIDGHFAGQAAKNRIDAAEAGRRAALVRATGELAAIGDADLVIEAVFEERAVKRELFAALDRVARPGAILASNTSSLDVLDLADATGRPADVVGLHFFSPAPVMRLLEIVRTDRTAPDVLATAVALAGRLRKTGVVVGNGFGFVANRMIFEYQRQSEFLVEEGASPADVDRVLKRFGLPMGPFEMFDMAGLDVGWRIRKDRAAVRAADRRTSVLNDLVCEAGWFGQKTRRGWYDYDARGRHPQPNPDLAPLVAEARARAGIAPRVIADDEILGRCLLALVNEGARILAEGKAARASDIDVMYVAGFGFPRWRGGPMHWADEQGLPQVLERVEGFAAQPGSGGWWQPAPLLVELARNGGSFAARDRTLEERA